MLVRTIAIAFCLTLCITSLPLLPRNMGKGHLASVPMTSLVPRILKPNWVSQKVVIARVTGKSVPMTAFCLSFYQGSEGVTRTLLPSPPALFSLHPQPDPSSHWRKGGHNPRLEVLAAQVQGEHRSALPRVPSQFLCISSTPADHGQVAHTSTWLGIYPESILRWGWRRFCSSERDGGSAVQRRRRAAKATDAHSFFICFWL